MTKQQTTHSSSLYKSRNPKYRNTQPTSSATAPVHDLADSKLTENLSLAAKQFPSRASSKQKTMCLNIRSMNHQVCDKVQMYQHKLKRFSNGATRGAAETTFYESANEYSDGAHPPLFAEKTGFSTLKPRRAKGSELTAAALP